MKTINKTDIAAAIAPSVMDVVSTELTVMNAFKAIGDQLAMGNRVYIVGFGTFIPAERKAREGVAPDGTPWSKPATIAATFKPAKGLKGKLNP